MTLYPNTSALYLAGLVKTALAASVMKLFKAISAPLSPSTVLGDFTECDYDGYTSKTITAWNNPYLDPAGGASIQSGTQQYDFVSVPLVTNVVLGFYVVNAAGALVFAGTFDAPIAMTQNGDSIPVNATLNFGALNSASFRSSGMQMPYYQKGGKQMAALNVAKVTLSFVQGAYGWTENYFLNAPSSNLQAELAKGNTLANKRLPMSGAQTQVTHIKVSNEMTKRDVILDLTTYAGNASKPSDAPDTAVLIKKYGALPQQSAPVYLRGVWDEVIVAGGNLDLTNAAWLAAYNAWVAELVSTSEGWGFLGLDPTSTLTAQIATVSQNVNGTIHVTLKTPTFGVGPYLPNQKVFISGVGGAASLNGADRDRIRDEHIRHGETNTDVPLYDWGQNHEPDTEVLADRIGSNPTRSREESGSPFIPLSWSATGAQASLVPYDPCGMIMDIARTSTDRDCAFFADNPTAATVHWYRAPPDAKVFPVAHKINHLAWYSFPWLAQGVGEIYGTPEVWNNGFTPPTAQGQGYFGPLEYFQEGAPYDSSVNVPRDTWGLAIACGTPDCFILEEPSYGPLILQEDGTGIFKEVCSS